MKFAVSIFLTLLLHTALFWNQRVHSFVPTMPFPAMALKLPVPLNQLPFGKMPLHLPLLAVSKDESQEITVTDVEDPPVALSEMEIRMLSKKLKSTFPIPHMPPMMEYQIIKLVITQVCKVAPIALPEGVFVSLVAGDIEWASVEVEVLKALNDEICIPLVPKATQDKLVNGICVILFAPESETKHRRKLLARHVQSALNEDSEEEFADMLDSMIDIPLIGREKNHAIALKLAKSIHNVFETLVPEPMRDVLTHSSPEELREARTNLVNRLNEKIDIPFKSEEEEEVYFKLIVDVLLKRYGLEKGAMMPKEEMKYVNHQLALLEEELDIHEAILHQTKLDLDEKMDRLKKRKDTLLSEPPFSVDA